MAKQPAVGFIGLGLMGAPMAHNLLKRGFPLTVYNRTRERTTELAAAGATIADSPRALAAQAEFVCSCVTGPRDVEAVYLGPEGVVAGAKPGAVLIEMSTIDPATHQRIAGIAAERGVQYLDAPVSGGVGGAEAGALTIMVGGEPAVVEQAQAVLDAMGENIMHMGAIGAGATTKLVNNLIASINAMGICEGMVLGVKAGVDPERLHAALMSATAASKGLGFFARSALRGNFEPGFTINNRAKDVELANDLARDLGLPAMASSLAAQLLRRAQAEGLGERDIGGEIIPLERMAGVKVRSRGPAEAL